SQVTAPTNPATEKGTDRALELAKSILASETSKQKLLIVMSDGQPSTCTVEKPSKSELELAKDIRGMGVVCWFVVFLWLGCGGVVVVYPSLSTLPTPLQQNITGDPDLVFRLDFDVLADIIAKLLGSTTTAAASTASAAASTASPTTKGNPTITTVSPAPEEKARKKEHRRELAIRLVKINCRCDCKITSGTSMEIPPVGVMQRVFKDGEGKVVEISVLVKLVNSLKNARIGVVAISCPSEILLTMGIYSESDIR
ncbi:hypothetical protein COOONC_14572, partial [Cooperia oncophora]